MDFRQKARLVEAGHMKKNSTTITYGSMVLRKIIHIDPAIAVLTGLTEIAANILNIYFQTFWKRY